MTGNSRCIQDHSFSGINVSQIKKTKQGKSEGYDSLPGLVILLKFDPNHRFAARATLKFDGWPRKKIGHLFYTTSSFVHHFKAMAEFKLELQSGNAQFGSKSAIFCPVWPWNLMDDFEQL